jgi:hypothetical protein
MTIHLSIHSCTQISETHLIYYTDTVLPSPIYPDNKELTTRGLNEPVEELYRLIDATLKHFFSREETRIPNLIRRVPLKLK